MRYLLAIIFALVLGGPLSALEPAKAAASTNTVEQAKPAKKHVKKHKGHKKGGKKTAKPVTEEKK